MCSFLKGTCFLSVQLGDIVALFYHSMYNVQTMRIPYPLVCGSEELCRLQHNWMENLSRSFSYIYTETYKHTHTHIYSTNACRPTHKLIHTYHTRIPTQMHQNNDTINNQSLYILYIYWRNQTLISILPLAEIRPYAASNKLTPTQNRRLPFIR